ncbi:glutathione S-transferase [Sphingomonas sp. PAMC 26605]|uniref:glutathione S-transferase n=1 Tax=Sphingomonas sp. PAMC 26605 TaxID=1112214 RepID=UPI00026CB1F3|nr:glutathione S-transferase [Sphingomonas sp. PAMC 26605]
MLATIVDEIERPAYLLGDTISAADILWGKAHNWGMTFKLVPESEPIVRYVERTTQRRAALKVAEMDAELAAEHERANTACG